MSYGFLALNDNNQVLVSSDTRNLHFIQKLTGPVETLYTIDSYGGIRQWRYRATCAAIPLPFFTMPTADSYGVARIIETSPGSGVWDIEILRTGTSGGYPEVYIFAEPKATSSADTYGMIVYADDGTTPVFDSRLKPLVVVGGISISQTAAIRYNGAPYGLSSDYCATGAASSGGVFVPEGVNTYSVPLVSNASKPIYSYNSLAQGQIMYNYNRSSRDCFGLDVYGGCVGYNEEKTYNSYYWCFYRGGVKKTTVNLGVPTAWSASVSYRGETITSTPEYAYDGDGNYYPTGAYTITSDFTSYGWSSATSYAIFGSSGGYDGVDDGFRIVSLPWAVRGPDYNNPSQTRLYYTMAVSTNGYITFNDSYSIRESHFASYQIQDPLGYRIAVAAGDYIVINVKSKISGTSPNRIVTYLVQSRPFGTGNATTPTIFWSITLFEADPSRIEYALKDGYNATWANNITGVFVAGTTIGTSISNLPSGTFNSTGVLIEGSSTVALQATWIPTRFNCWWQFQENTYLFGIGIGDGGNNAGQWPYNNETLNIISNAVVIADGAKYD